MEVWRFGTDFATLDSKGVTRRVAIRWRLRFGKFEKSQSNFLDLDCSEEAAIVVEGITEVQGGYRSS